MKTIRREFLGLVAGACIFPKLAWAQAYPSRPITLIVPFPPGGTTDILSRALAERMRTSLGQPIVIENIGGASGTIGVARAARAAPDGHTLEMGQFTSHIVPAAIQSVPYDVANDFAPVAPVATVYAMLYVKKAMPANDLEGFISWLKANPDKASQGTTTAGMHALGAFFQRETGTRFQFVPYKGAAPAIQDLIGGHIDFVLDSPVHLPHVRAGLIKCLAVSSKTRLKIAPDVPTFQESSLPALNFSPWFALFAPKGTAKPLIEKLNSAALDALDDPVIRGRLEDQGYELYPVDQRTPEALAAIVKADIDKWWPIIKAANIQNQ